MTKDGKTNVIRPKTTFGARNRALALLGILCLSVSSCGNDNVADDPRVPEPSAPATLDYSFVWHESPAADLNSPTGTFIRAATESLQRSLDFGSISSGFPGFDTAVEDSSPSVSELVHDLGNLPTEVPDAAGALDTRILSAETDGVDTRAIVCVYQDRYLVSSSGTESYQVGADDEFDTRATEVAFKTEGTPPPSKVFGPQAMPASDAVFGEWKVSYIDFDLHDKERTEQERIEQDCRNTRGEIPRIPDEGKTVPKNDPSASIPPSPGWSNAPAV